jgi:hypothetical protein
MNLISKMCGIPIPSIPRQNLNRLLAFLAVAKDAASRAPARALAHHVGAPGQTVTGE